MDINFKTDSGFTPLLAAVSSTMSDARNLETVRFLLESGADATVTMTGPKLKKLSVIEVAKNCFNPKIAALLKKTTQQSDPIDELRHTVKSLSKYATGSAMSRI